MDKGIQKKKEKLGMNYSTARNRLIKDLLFKAMVELKKNTCHRCLKEMTREDFTLDHKEAWLNSNNPIELFFDTNNVAFSHSSCNTSARVDTGKKYFTEEEKKAADKRYYKKWYYKPA